MRSKIAHCLKVAYSYNNKLTVPFIYLVLDSLEMTWPFFYLLVLSLITHN